MWTSCLLCLTIISLLEKPTEPYVLNLELSRHPINARSHLITAQLREKWKQPIHQCANYRASLYKQFPILTLQGSRSSNSGDATKGSSKPKPKQAFNLSEIQQQEKNGVNVTREDSKDAKRMKTTKKTGKEPQHVTNDQRWELRFQQLQEFKTQFGHCNVPKRYPDNPQLGQWVSTQRQKKDTMPKSCKEKLESIGFKWYIPQDHKWERRFVQLQEFKAQHGHCNVPQNYADNAQLARWVLAQRHQKDKMPKDHYRKLESIGFVWDFDQALWELRFEQLQQFKAQYGHCNVPQRYPDNPQLGNWIRTQRTQRATIPMSCKEKLESICFEWSVTRGAKHQDHTWELRFEQLQQFRAQYGHCDVPQRYPDNPQLGNWISTQRTQRDTMPTSRKNKLESIGFEWSVTRGAKYQDHTWKQRFVQLQEFKAQHGHCNVPYNYPNNPQLARWVLTQRQLKDKMPKDRYRKLESIGFEWSSGQGSQLKDQLWELRFERLQQFRAQYGHCNVPQRYPENPELGIWVKVQRRKKKKMPEDRYKKLECIGFEWSVARGAKYQDHTWELRFEQLQKFKAQHGHCNVPQNYPENSQLGSWVKKQRQNMDTMPMSRKGKLESIGFEWSMQRRTKSNVPI